MRKKGGPSCGTPSLFFIKIKGFNAEPAETGNQNCRVLEGRFFLCDLMNFSAPSALTALIWLDSDFKIQEAPVNSMPRRVTSSLFAEPRPKA